MRSSGKFRIAIVAASSFLVTMGLAALPTASADVCTVTVTTVTGQSESFTVDASPGTPASALVPGGLGPVRSISESCAPPAVATTSHPTTTSSSSSSSSGSGNGSGSSSGPPKVNGSSNQRQSSQQPPSKGPPPPPKSGGAAPGASHPSGPPAPPPPRGPGGVPTPSNPTFSFATPGPVQVGVPNFFIDNFQMPPFLIPIYQAAGIEYDVPWNVLAAINEIETDYGRNLSTSSAGAIGWMQFEPSTWKQYAVDANGDGVADPYNPVDAIFTAAKYLHAAGASKNIAGAIYAYNHADWYVQSVLLRAKLIGAIPGKLIGALASLVQGGHFPVAAKAKYADDAVEKLAKSKPSSSNPAVTVGSDPNATGTSIYANQNSPVVAVNDGKVLKLGQSPQLGKYLELQDDAGNVYTYAQLGSIPNLYPVPKPQKLTAAQIAQTLIAPTAPKPTAPATAGTQQSTPTVSPAKAAQEASKPISLPVTGSSSGSATSSIPAPLVKERLFANPYRPASFAAGGDLQIKNTTPQITNFQDYFSDVLHLDKNQYTLQPLKAGSIVVAGTIIGRLAAPSSTTASHLLFKIRPAGNKAPYIDPKPILDGWKLLEATAVYRAEGVNPFYGPGAKSPTIGQILLMSKIQLTNRVLEDPHVQIYACGRQDIQAGLISRNILAVIEFLSASGLKPTVSGLECGHTANGSNGVDAAGATGNSVDISKIDNIPIQGHQGKGSITDLAIRRLLTLQGAMKPDEIVSSMSYKGQSNTLSLPDHANRIQITYTPLFGNNKQLSAQAADILQPAQWDQLINRLSAIPEPVVPITPSQYAIRTSGP